VRSTPFVGAWQAGKLAATGWIDRCPNDLENRSTLGVRRARCHVRRGTPKAWAGGKKVLLGGHSGTAIHVPAAGRGNRNARRGAVRLRIVDVDFERSVVYVRQSAWRGQIQSPMSEKRSSIFCASSGALGSIGGSLQRSAAKRAGIALRHTKRSALGREPIGEAEAVPVLCGTILFGVHFEAKAQCLRTVFVCRRHREAAHSPCRSSRNRHGSLVPNRSVARTSPDAATCSRQNSRRPVG